MPSLYRTRDGAGDAGGMSDILRINPDTNELEYKHSQKPTVGWAIRVGSISARSFSSQDYWTTTPVTEILEEREDYVKFKTGNSIYEWKN